MLHVLFSRQAPVEDELPSPFIFKNKRHFIRPPASITLRCAPAAKRLHDYVSVPVEDTYRPILIKKKFLTRKR